MSLPDRLIVFLGHTLRSHHYTDMMLTQTFPPEVDWCTYLDIQQLSENLSRKGYAPLREEPREVMWNASIFVVFSSRDYLYAAPHPARAR